MASFIMLTEDEKIELDNFYSNVYTDITHVLDANLQHGNLTIEQRITLRKTIEERLPSRFDVELGLVDVSKYGVVTSKSDLLARLDGLSKEIPVLRGVYKKYDAQVVRPVYCINCGTELLSSARFCPDCGTEVTTPEEE